MKFIAQPNTNRFILLWFRSLWLVISWTRKNFLHLSLPVACSRNRKSRPSFRYRSISRNPSIAFRRMQCFSRRFRYSNSTIFFMCRGVSSWTRGNTNVEMLQFLFFNSKSRSPAKSSQLLCITKINISILFQIVIRSLTTLRLGSNFWTHRETSFYFRLQTKLILDPVLTRWIIQHSRPGESDLSWFGLDDLPIKIDTFLLSILSAFKVS